MKKIVLRFLLLFGILGVLNVIIASQLPLTWAEQIIDLKYRNYQIRSGDVDVLFIGSSRTYRHVSPTQFANQVESVTGELTAYNLGSLSYYYPKTYLLLKEILNDKPDELDTVFLELGLNNSPASELRHTTQHKYWYTLDTGSMLIQSVFDTRTQWQVRANMIYTHAISTVEKYLNLGVGRDVLQFMFERDPEAQSSALGEELDGFNPLSADNASAIQRERNQQLISNPTQLATRTTDARRAYQDRNSFERYSLAYHETVTELLELAESKGVELYFILPPRLTFNEYQIVLPVFEQLPDSRRIDLGDPVLHPEFYSMRLSWDRGHLNQDGAEIYTKRLADAFVYLQTDFIAADSETVTTIVAADIEQAMLAAVDRWESGDWEGLRDQLSSLALSDTQLADPYFYLGLMDEQEENWDSADFSYRLAAQRPNTLTIGRSDVQVRLANLAIQTIEPRSWELIGPYAERAIEFDDFRFDTEIIPTIHFYNAQGFAASGKGGKALEEYKLVVDQYRDELDTATIYNALVGYGEYTWLVEEDFDQAVELIEEAIGLSEQSIYGYMRLAKVYRQAAQPEEAINLYNHVLSINPNHVGANQNLADLTATESGNE